MAASAGSLIPFKESRNHSLSPDDITYTFALLGVYDLPFGNGKRWLSSPGFLAQVVGG